MDKIMEFLPFLIPLVIAEFALLGYTLHHICLLYTSIPVNTTTGQPERLGKIIFVKGKKQEDTPQIGAGDIGAVTKLAGTNTGDMLCDPSRPLKCEPMEFPAPCLSIAFKPKAKGDEGKIAQALQRLMEEDRTIAYENNVETKQQIVTGLGEQHLAVLVSKMKARCV